MRTRNAREIGDWGERYAVHYLRRHGYTVKERNYRAGHHEIDIVASTFRTIAFVEVKTRSYAPEEDRTLPPPGHAVNAEKQRCTRRAAQRYLFEHPTRKKPRMDVLEIWLQAVPNGHRPKVLRVRHLIGAY